MGVEDGNADADDLAHGETPDKPTVSTVVALEERAVSQDNVDSDLQPESTQSLEEDCSSPAIKSQERSFSDDLRHGDTEAPVCRNGVMDLSGRGLTQLDRKFRKEYGCVKKLIISGNQFNNIAGFDMFKQCIKVDASDNQLHKLSSFLPLARVLKALYLSNNAITNIDCLRSFLNLETLDVSCNDIECIPATLDNPRLSHLDLSSNAISSLPDLHKLRALTHLDVSSNKISSLKTAALPKRLASFNLASNNIDDLTEFMRLLPLEKIESISLANNPCVSNPSFDYRIYILSVLPSLQDIDGFIVSEEEQLKGEWLYSQGKGRSFKPDTGAHAALVKYLERYCPFDVEGKLVSTLDQSVVRVMEKRREMLSNSGFDDDSSHSLSVHSPYGAWAAQLEGKENQIPSSSADESSVSADRSAAERFPVNRRSISARTPHSSTPGRTVSVTSRPVSQFEPLSRTSTMDSVDSSSTVTLVPAVKGNQEFSRGTVSTATTAKVGRSARMFLQERIVQLEEDERDDNRSKDDQCSSEYAEPCRVSEITSDRTNVSRKSNEHMQSRPSPTPVVTDISVDMGPSRSSTRDNRDKDIILRRIACLEDRVSTLTEENENLTRINDELSKLLVEMTNRFTNDVNSLKSEFASAKTAHKPEPCNVRIARELDNGCYEIVWDLPIVKCYKVLTNGVESGVIRAPNNAARISDVDPGVEINVQLQAVHLDGTLGEPSVPLTIRRSPR